MPTILERAQRLHRAYERRMVKNMPFYPGTSWDELSGDDQAEFLELATTIHSNLDMRPHDLAVLLCKHYKVHPGRDQAAYWQEVAHRRVRLAVLAFVLGLVLGFVFHMVIAAPPVWIGEVTAAAAQCGAL